MRRRLDLAASLILAPRVLFLDEPTTGPDPRSRNEVWDAVRALVADGTTVLLTTQYLDEADQLADRISVIDPGRVIAEGTPDELKARIGGDRSTWSCATPTTLAGRGVGASPGSCGAGASTTTGAALSGPRTTGRGARARCCGRWTTPASRPRTSGCAGRRSTRCSCT